MVLQWIEPARSGVAMGGSIALLATGIITIESFQ
jgi:hypothetical protein